MQRLVAVALVVTSMALHAASVAAAPAQRPPNVIFILIDDMGYGDLSCYGEQRVHTDHIDRLAREGIKFNQFYVNAPICSPSRTALTTGQYPARWKITSFLSTRKENTDRHMAQWLDPTAPTLARQLKSAGYTTGHFGKWHMGGQRDVGEAPLVADYGFDAVLTTFEGLGDRVLPLMDAFDGKPAQKYGLGVMSERLGRGNVTWADRSTETSHFVDAALNFIKKAEADDKPFYVNVWPDDVHSPFFPPQALRGDGSKKQLYLGVVQATDDQLAPLLDYVRNSPKLRDNTMIVLASDNGPEPGAGSPGPFRGHKGNLYEGGIREPLIVWAPGLLPKDIADTVNDKTVVAGIDFLPTILALTGPKPAAGELCDGEDLSPSFTGHAQQMRTKPLFWLRPPDRPGPKNDPFPDLAVREGDWKLLVNADGSHPQLYDLATDPIEARESSAQHADVVERLKKKVLEWRKSLPVDDAHVERKDIDPRDPQADAG